MRTLRLHVFGIVQGVGFRPFVHRLATQEGFCGTVANKGSLVEIFLQKEKTSQSELTPHEQTFIRLLRETAPERSFIMKVIPVLHDEAQMTDFTIIESAEEEGDIFVSPDIATCPHCEAELFDPENRRYLHPFINCTACGPRLTILDSMPYDRERTSMKVFPMCPECEREYTDPPSRRFDAQPVCCNACGPTISLMGEDLHNLEAIRFARKEIREGKILAIKGIGGFHLCCDARSFRAVETLRERKRRPSKPFAIMFRDRQSLEKECFVDAEESALLEGWQKPILLVKKRSTCSIADNVAPNNPRLGVMLPYTPLHLLLFSLPDDGEMTDALIMTSGNVSGAPICKESRDAQKELGHLADHILTHNRHINIRSDDSVVLVRDCGSTISNRLHVFRRSRGFAPLPVIPSLEFQGACLGMGSELKNTFCLAQNGLFYLSPHVGDLGDLRASMALKETLTRMEELLRIRPQMVACDSHPRYISSTLARELGLPCIEVQHHYAHILSCMAENECLENCIGVAFDGTGYGEDGSIWGGEILLTGLDGFTRFAHLDPFPQTGGEAATREGFRIAISLLTELYGAEKAGSLSQRFRLATEEMIRVQIALTQKRVNSMPSSSCGRLFDGVASLLGFCHFSRFEGEAAGTLQFAAERFLAKHGNSLPQTFAHAWEKIEESLLQKRSIPTLALFECMVTMREKNDPEECAALFHHLLAKCIAHMCCAARKESQYERCALSGGVFQNVLLERLLHDELHRQGFQVLTHHTVPANDGGLALGQALFAANRLRIQNN